MAIIYQFPTPITGSTGISPNFKYMVVGDALATVVAAGYLKQNDLQGYPLSPTDILQVFYSFNPVTKTGTFGTFGVAVSGAGVITLTEYQSASGVNATLPTIVNHIATYSNVSGDITEDAATAINGGNLQAGLSGTAGSLISFPGTAAKGSLNLTAVNNTGNTITTISNAAMGQASTISIPDPAGATANFAIAPSALVNANLVQASGTAGLVADSGIAASTVQLKTNIKSGTASFGGLGAGPFNLVVPGLLAGSPLSVSITNVSNAVGIKSVLFTVADTAQVTFTADPGATANVSYIAFVVPQ